MFEGGVGQGDATGWTERAGEAALLVRERATDDRRDLVVGQGLEAPDPHPRQERGVDLEVGVLGRRSDQRDGAVLDVGQQGVLLRLVEAVDLVEEEDRARPVQIEPILSVGDGAADLDDARHDSRHRREMRPDLGGEKAREARLAGPWWSPQQERREMPARDAPAERPALADEVALADELVEVPGTHPGGQRLPLRRWLEEGLGLGADRSTGGWHVRDGSAANVGHQPVPRVVTQMHAGCSLGGLRGPERCRGPRRGAVDGAVDVGVHAGRASASRRPHVRPGEAGR